MVPSENTFLATKYTVQLNSKSVFNKLYYFPKTVIYSKQFNTRIQLVNAHERAHIQANNAKSTKVNAMH